MAVATVAVAVVVSELFSLYRFFNLKPWGSDPIRRALFPNGLKSPNIFRGFLCSDMLSLQCIHSDLYNNHTFF